MCPLCLVLLIPLAAIAIFVLRLGAMIAPKRAQNTRPWEGEERSMEFALARAAGHAVAIAKSNPPAK